MTFDIEGKAGERLLDRLRQADAQVSAPCGGRGRCGKCRVRIQGSGDCLAPPGEVERSFLTTAELDSGWRLSCAAVFAKAGPLSLEPVLGEMSIPLDRYTAVAGSSGAPDRPKSLHLAVDLGTTTIVVQLVDPETGESYGSAAEPNRQRAWGADVVSRIEAAKDPAVLARMRVSALSQIESLLGYLCGRAGKPSASVGEIAVAGNTVMLHLLAGCDPSGLGSLPFAPVFLSERRIDPLFPGLEGDRMLLLPGISAFVGADIVAGILATGLAWAREPELLIDIGTNGEIALVSPRGLHCTATAAGPAFEGAHIACGSPSIAGAIDHAGWDGAEFWRTTIDGEAPIGICGSGLIDIAAALRSRGIVDETGFMEGAEGGEGGPRFYVDAARKVFVSQSDLRQVQLAKGAIAAGVRALCLEAGLALENIRRVHLAGGFGSYLDPQSALTIGMLPAEFRGKVVAEGNSSLRGAIKVACGGGALEACRAIARSAVSIDLSARRDFQDLFMDSMLFPDDAAIEGLAADYRSTQRTQA